MRVKNSLSAISSFSPKKKKKNRAQELREHVHHIYRAYERREKEGEKRKREPISKFVRVLIKRDCVANGRKGGNRSGDAKEGRSSSAGCACSLRFRDFYWRDRAQCRREKRRCQGRSMDASFPS